MPFLPVDTAIVVEVGPLIGDTDWQSLETGIVYNESGMSVKLLVNSGTSLRNTNITPSSGGSYDWTHKGGGVYELEIPSGLNANDTEGTLRVVGVCDGVLPFESPCYTVVPANVYNSLVKGTDVLDVSLTEIEGDAQSAADLKDFADAGYDPATNKVQGVVLVDTTTANTDMVGTDSAALASVLGAAAGASISADIAAVKAETATIEGQTDDIGVAGAGLSAIPWNNADWDAQVESEVNDALVVLGLDHLLSTTVAGSDVADNSVIAKMVSKSATADWDDFVNTTDSLQAIRDAIVLPDIPEPPTPGEIADAVWDEPASDHVAANTFGQQCKTDIDAVLADTNELQGDDVPTLIAGVQSDTDDIQTRLPASLVGGRMDADMQAVSEDTGAADNLESMYDGTGYTADTAPASRAQVGALGLTGGGTLNFEANADNSGGTIDPGSTAFVGNETNNYTDTALEDGTYHVITDDTNIIDVVYGFSVGGGRTATEMIFRGFANANNDDLAVSAWNHVSPGWDVLDTLEGKPSTSNVNLIEQLLSRHTGTSATEIGKVYIRFNGSGLTGNADLNTDQILVEAVSIGQSVGYTEGAIWVDTNATNTNTEPFVDGVADNPVSTWAAALTLSTSLKIYRFHIVNGSTIALSANSDNYTLSGSNWTLATASQSVVGIHVDGATVSGIMTGTGATQTFVNCHLLGCTHIKGLHALQCGVEGTQLVSEAGDYFLDSCHSGIAGTATWIFDFGAAIGNTNLNLRNYSGGVQLEKMGNAGTDTASIEGWGQIIEGTCTAGVVAVRGNFTVSGISNLTLSDDARIDVDQINAEADTALSDYDGPTHAELISEIDDVQTDIAALNDISAADVDTTLTAAHGAGAWNTTATDWDANEKAQIKQALGADGTSGTPAAAGDVRAIQGAGFAAGTHSLVALRNYLESTIAPSIVAPAAASTLVSGSFIARVIDQIRRYTDDPTANAKYSDNDLIAKMRDAWSELWVELSNNAEWPLIVRLDVTINTTDMHYQLPVNLGRLLRLAKINAGNEVMQWEVDQNSYLNPSGFGMKIEGNTLRLGRRWTAGDTLRLEYIPGGEIAPIAGEWTAPITYSGRSVTLPSTVANGNLETRENGYAGMFLRTIIPDGTAPVADDPKTIQQERLITAYDPVTRVLTLATDQNPDITFVAGELEFEVVPVLHNILDQLVALRAAMDILAGEGEAKRRTTLISEYRLKLRAMRQEVSAVAGRRARQFEGDVVENRHFGPWIPWGRMR